MTEREKMAGRNRAAMQIARDRATDVVFDFGQCDDLDAWLKAQVDQETEFIHKAEILLREKTLVGMLDHEAAAYWPPFGDMAERIIADLDNLPVPDGDGQYKTGQSWLCRIVESLPLIVGRETRKDGKRLLPQVPYVAAGQSPQEELPNLHIPAESCPQATIPALIRDDQRIPILDILDQAGAPLRSRGRGAPIAARLFLSGMLSIPLANRHPGKRHLSDWRLRDLIRELYPTGGYRNNCWPAIREAMFRADALRIDTGRESVRFLSFPRIPHQPEMDFPVPMLVTLPSKILHPHGGAPIALPHLQRMGSTSGPRWRAYIALCTLMWIPGKTRRPVGKGRRHWVWSVNESDYPVIDKDMRRHYAFGPHDQKHRTASEVDAVWLDMPGFRLVNKRAIENGITGWRFMPELPAIETA